MQKINRLLLGEKERRELAELFTSYIYSIVLLWYEKYQKEENNLPESRERKHALVASIDAISQLSTAYKLLFRELYSNSKREFKKNAKQLYLYAARSLELLRVEQRLRALRYQKLPRVAWQHCNQLFFSLAYHNQLDNEYKLIGLLGVRKSSDRLRAGSVPDSTVRRLYLSIQLFGLLDVTTWPTRMFHVPDAYLDFLKGEGLKLLADDDTELHPGLLVTFCKNDGPPQFRVTRNTPSLRIRLDYTALYNTLVKDHKEIGKQQFLDVFDESAISRPLLHIPEADRVPVIEMMIMGLTERERRQKRHASFDDSSLRVYFGFHDVNKLLTDLNETDQESIRSSRQFIDTLAMSSALLAEEEKHYMNASWKISNFSAGGVLMSTEETDFSNPIHIDMLMAFTMPDNEKHPILGFVRRLNRPNAKEVEIAVVRLSNYAEAAGIQALDEMDSSVAKAAILIKNIRNDWNLIVKTGMHYSKGDPMKLIRANGSHLPVRLGEVIYTKKDFRVFELRSPNLTPESQ